MSSGSYSINTEVNGRPGILSFVLTCDIASCGLASINAPVVYSTSVDTKDKFTYEEIEQYVETRLFDDMVKAVASNSGYTPSVFVLVEAINYTNIRSPVHKALLTGRAGRIVEADWIANSAHKENPWGSAVKAYLWVPTAKEKYLVEAASGSTSAYAISLKEKVRALTA